MQGPERDMTGRTRPMALWMMLVATLTWHVHVQAVTYPTPPVPKLVWGSCASSEATAAGAQCTTAQVPLDYRHPTRKFISLAVIKRPALKPAMRKGSMFFHFGGPGQSGVQDLVTYLERVPAAIQDAFDLVSWDPRGVGLSTHVTCWNSTAEYAAYWSTKSNKENVNMYYPTTYAASQEWLACIQNLPQACKKNGELLNYMSSADTARDVDVLRQAVGDNATTFWAISYGTVVGATYINLFPKSIRAILLDGVVDPVYWFANTGLSSRLRRVRDTSEAKSFNDFLRLCGQAPHTQPGACAFSADSYQATRAKWDQLLATLRKRGRIPVPAPVKANLAECDVANLIAVMIMPIPIWWELGVVLQTLWEQKDNTTMNTPLPVLSFSDGYGAPEQVWATQCEASNPTDPNFYYWQAQAEEARSGVQAAVSSWMDAPCLAWPGKAKNVYKGPWNAPTSVPILVIGTTGDGATAYENAVEVAASRLSNGHLLTLNGYGHTHLLSGYSACIDSYVSAYFLNGTLPAPDTVCQQDCTPFTNTYTCKQKIGTTLYS